MTTPPPPAGVHLFNGTPAILELSDTLNLDCLVLSGTTAVLTTDKTQCLLVTPFLVPYGYLLGIGDLEDINDAENCLVPSGSSFVSGTCAANQASIVTDIPGIDGLRFPLRRFSPDYLGACLTRSGTSLVFAGCPVTPTSSQLWYDKEAAPRTDPCVAWELTDQLSVAEPLRTQLPSYAYGSAGPSLSDYYNFQILGAAREYASHKARLKLRAKTLGRYLNSGNDLQLTKADMSKVVSAGYGSDANNNVAKHLWSDVTKSTVSASGNFATMTPPSVTARGTFNGMSKFGQPVDSGDDTAMDPNFNWFRVKSPDSEFEFSYPATAEDVWYGLGSFDLRTQGKLISGYRCFNVYLYDYYAFGATGLPVFKDYPSWAPAANMTDNEVAKLHRTGLAKNYHTNGKYVGCFVAPGAARITCPGIAKLS